MDQSEVRQSLIDAVNKRQFFESLNDFEFRDIHVKESIIVAELVDLHNTAFLNLNDLFLQLEKADHQYGFYSLIYLYCSALPKLECSVVESINVYLHFQAQELPTADFEEYYFQFCKKDIERSKAALTYLLAGQKQGYSLVANTVMAAAEHEPAWVMEQLHLLMGHQSSDVRWQSYLATGRVVLTDGKLPIERLELLENALKHETDSLAKSGIFRSAGFLAKQIPSLWSRVDLLMESSLTKLEPELLNEASYLISYGQKEVPNETILLIVPYLKNISPKHKGILNYLSYFIRQAIKSDDLTPIAEDLLADLLNTNNELNIEDFEHLPHSLISSDKSFLNRITTKWLLSGETRLCKVIHDIINNTGLNGAELEFDPNILPLTDNETLFLARKAVGWLYLHPISAISYLLSILPHASSGIQLQIGQLLYDPLLLSYTGKGKDYLSEKLDGFDRDIQIIVRRLLSELDSYRSNIEKVVNVKELRAPQREVDLYWKEFNTQMHQSMNESRKNSILDAIATTQTILYGNDVATYMRLGDQGQRVVNTMHSFSHSSELPRLNIVDPEGLDLMLRIFRIERFIDEADS